MPLIVLRFIQAASGAAGIVIARLEVRFGESNVFVNGLFYALAGGLGL